jgi:hypothetical protein
VQASSKGKWRCASRKSSLGDRNVAVLCGEVHEHLRARDVLKPLTTRFFRISISDRRK